MHPRDREDTFKQAPLDEQERRNILQANQEDETDQEVLQAHQYVRIIRRGH